MNEVLKQCPVCSGQLHIGKLTCHSCHSEVSGSFKIPGDSLPLDQEIIDFIKVFIFTEGSIKQSEKLMNCSYPKIKNLLKKTKSALGLTDEFTTDNQSVIDQLDQGKIDVEEALRKLKGE